MRIFSGHQPLGMLLPVDTAVALYCNGVSLRQQLLMPGCDLWVFPLALAQLQSQPMKTLRETLFGAGHQVSWPRTVLLRCPTVPQQRVTENSIEDGKEHSMTSKELGFGELDLYWVLTRRTIRKNRGEKKLLRMQAYISIMWRIA